MRCQGAFVRVRPDTCKEIIRCDIVTTFKVRLHQCHNYMCPKKSNSFFIFAKIRLQVQTLFGVQFSDNTKLYAELVWLIRYELCESATSFGWKQLLINSQ